MTDKQIIIDGCEFQSDCVEYKDISYSKIMPICAIHELSIACHDKVNKCKYYKLYKQLKRAESQIVDLNKMVEAKEQECERLKKQYNCYACDTCKGKEDYINLKRHCENAIKTLHNKHVELDQLKQTLIEIKKIADRIVNDYDGNQATRMSEEAELILQKISECEGNNDMENN